jgi:hypothetical protein
VVTGISLRLRKLKDGRHQPFPCCAPPLPHRGVHFPRHCLTSIEGSLAHITLDYKMVSFDPHKATSTTDETRTNLLLDYAGADSILLSQDFYHFRVSMIYILNSSPILGELVQRALLQ